MSKNKFQVNDRVRLRRGALKERLLSFIEAHVSPKTKTLSPDDCEVLEALIEGFVFKEDVEGVIYDLGAVDDETGLYYLRVSFDIGLPWDYDTVVSEAELKLIERPA